jgi:hypothetical protein
VVGETDAYTQATCATHPLQARDTTMQRKQQPVQRMDPHRGLIQLRHSLVTCKRLLPKIRLLGDPNVALIFVS